MKTAAEIAQQLNNETWDEILMAHRGVSAGQVQQALCEAYQQALTDAAEIVESGTAGGPLRLRIVQLRDSKKPKQF